MRVRGSSNGRMRKILVFLATAGLVAGIGYPAARGAGPARAPALLLPLSESDLTATHETGCEIAFNAGRSTLLYAVGHDFMLRTRAGRHVCPIGAAEFGALSEGGSRSCGDVRVTVRRTGRTIDNPAADSSSSPATLTVTGGGRTWTIRGSWGTAC